MTQGFSTLLFMHAAYTIQYNKNKITFSVTEHVAYKI